MDSESSVCMDKNCKNPKNTRHISSRVHFIRNGKSYNMHKIDWCEVGMQLSDIPNNNVGENDLNPRIKYIMVRIDNWDITLVQEGWQNTG